MDKAQVQATFMLLQRIVEFRCEYMSKDVKKMHINLTNEYYLADATIVYDHFSNDNLIRIHWHENNFFISRF